MRDEAPDILSQASMSTYEDLLSFGEALASYSLRANMDSKMVSVLTQLMKEQRLTLQALAESPKGASVPEEWSDEELEEQAAKLGLVSNN